MKTRHLLGGIAAFAFLAAGAALPAAAQTAPTNEELSNRVDSIETKLDALIELMTKQETGERREERAAGDAEEDGGEADEAASAAVEEGSLRPGLTLDLYTVRIPQDIENIATGSSDAPAASEVIAAPKVFEWSAFVGLPTMKRYSGPMDRRVALQWSGMLRVPEPGKHTFQVEIFVDQQSRTSSCVVVLSVGGRNVIRANSVARSAGYYDGEQRSTLEQGSIDLSEGMHAFSLWGHCLGGTPNFDRVHFNLLSKGPSDRAPKPIEPSRFFTQG